MEVDSVATPVTPEGLLVSAFGFSSIRDQLVRTIHPFSPFTFSSLACSAHLAAGGTGHYHEKTVQITATSSNHFEPRTICSTVVKDDGLILLNSQSCQSL